MSNPTIHSHSSLYAIFDVKAGSYGTPFVSRNDDEAKRSLALAFNHPSASDNVIARFPEDFILVWISFWSVIAGLGVDGPFRTVATLSQILKPSTSPAKAESPALPDAQV